MATEQEQLPVAEQRPSRHSKKNKQKRGPQRPENVAMNRATASFAACGRCSYFWAGSRVIAGEAAIETAVSRAADGWISLTWNQAMSNLVHKSYGVRIDTEFYHYESYCEECRRAYVCFLPEEPTPETAVPLEETDEIGVEETAPQETVVEETAVPPKPPVSFAKQLPASQNEEAEVEDISDRIITSPPTSPYQFKIQLAM
jgi:hypothetical protein